MATGPGEHYDFFLSRRGSVAAVAREVTDVLTEKGYRVLSQDYDIPLGASFIEKMHEGVKNARDTSLCCSRATTSSHLTLEWSSRASRRMLPKARKNVAWSSCVARTPLC